MARAIDLNADMGEYWDAQSEAIEIALTPLVTTVSIACGGHAGDRATMNATLARAREAGIAVGAHPAYPDREGFGRRALGIAPDALASSIRRQIDALEAAALAAGVTLTHVKPHGALYNDAARNEGLAAIIVEAARGKRIICPPDSALARRAGAAALPEGFVDRKYRADGALTPRMEPGAVIADVAARAAQARRIAAGEPIATDGPDLTLAVETLCIHSDTPGAVETARAVRKALDEAGIAIRPPAARS